MPRTVLKWAIASIAIPLTAVAQDADFAAYAMQHPGDPVRGAKVFAATSSLCSSCHSIDGSSSKAGPDLSRIGNKFDRNDLIRAVIEPSADIAVGYGSTSIRTRNRDQFTGVLKSATSDEIELMGMDGESKKIQRSEIQSEQPLTVSLMPAGLQHAVGGLEPFADLIAFLESLREDAGNDIDADGSYSVIADATAKANLTPLFGLKFHKPSLLAWLPGRAKDAALVLEYEGRLLEIQRIGTSENFQQQVVFDMRQKVRPGGATGLLGLDFHPDFLTNHLYFIKYHTQENGEIFTIVEEREFHEGVPDQGDGKEIFRSKTVTQDHNGGTIRFGPDGYLYIGLGDSGPQRDPQGHGQDLGVMYGKILRIDVDHPAEGKSYGIPADNPFVGKVGALPEIWAYGFREPYRFSWDRETGDFWVGDVGQDQIEEVSIVRAGENLGWNVYEGHHPYSETYRRNQESYVEPVMSYTHRLGVSVTGGFVYRGKQAPQMDGWYLFGDFERRGIWALTQHDRKLTQVVTLGRAPSRITAFVEDPDGEIQVVGFDDGIIYQLDMSSVDPRPLQVQVLADLGERSAAVWKYSSDAPPENWADIGFDDADWNLGPSPFGTTSQGRRNVKTPWDSPKIWLRREFQVSSEMAATNGRLALDLRALGEMVVYLNGQEVHRAAGGWHGNEEILLPESVHLREGKNIIAIEGQRDDGNRYLDAGLKKKLPPSQKP